MKVLPPDTEPRNYKERLTEVSERLPVLVHGIQPEFTSPLLDLVRMDTTTEQKPTKEFTELEKALEKPMTMPQLKLISLKRTSLPWVDSHTMDASSMTMSCLRDAPLVSEREPSCSERELFLRS